MRFSIRDLFLVTVIVAVCVAWWLERRARIAIQAEHELPHRQHQAAIRHAKVRAERAAAPLPTPQAPAPIPPKP
jgi:hypothetical protein